MNKYIFVLIFVLCAVSVSATHFDNCYGSINMTLINSSTVVDAAEYKVTPCINTTANTWICNCSDVRVYTLVNAINNYTFKIDYGSTQFVQEYHSPTDNGVTISLDPEVKVLNVQGIETWKVNDDNFINSISYVGGKNSFSIQTTDFGGSQGLFFVTEIFADKNFTSLSFNFRLNGSLIHNLSGIRVKHYSSYDNFEEVLIPKFNHYENGMYYFDVLNITHLSTFAVYDGKDSFYPIEYANVTHINTSLIYHNGFDNDSNDLNIWVNHKPNNSGYDGWYTFIGVFLIVFLLFVIIYAIYLYRKERQDGGDNNED